MEVYVPVDRQRTSIAKRREEALNLSLHLHPKLRAQSRGPSSCDSACPECCEPSTESAAVIDQQIDVSRRRKGLPLEQIQVQAHREVRTTLQRGDGMFPAGAVDDYASAAEPPPIMAGHNRIGYPFGQTAVVSMKNRNKPR